MSKSFELMQFGPGIREEVRPEFIKPRPVVIPHPEPSIRIAVEAFYRQWKLFLGTSLLILFLTLIYTILTHKEYLSEMKFIVQNARENVVVTPEPTSQASVGDVTETQVNSELEILHSHDVIDQVADPGWAAVPQSRRTIGVVRDHEELVASFESRLSTDIVHRTNVIRVSIRANSPEKAQKDMERLAAAYLLEHRRLQRPEGASEFFVSEAERARKEWNDATSRLVSFQKDHQLLSVPDRESFLNDLISKNQNELFVTNSTIREMDVQLSEASHRLKDIPSRQLTQEQIAPNQSTAGQMETLLVGLENKRTTLLTNYKATDRLVRELDQQIATVKTALEDAKTVATQQQTTDVDPAWQQVRTNYVQSQITRQAITERRAVLEQRVNNLQQELANLQNVNVQFNNLQTQTDELKQNYQLYLQKRDQAQIEDAMDEHKILNVTVVQQPTSSHVPVRPKPTKNALLGLVTAAFVGLCAVYFAEIGRSTIATPRELDAISRYPVLATVPRTAVFDTSTIENEPTSVAHFIES